MARGRRGSSVATKLGFLIYGTFGSWKSSLCLDFARMKTEDGRPFRVLYIDAESGSVDSYLEQLEAEGINTENIYLLYTQSLGEVREYIKKVSNNEDLYELDDDGEETEQVILDADGKPFRADAIVVDGTTIIHMATQQGLIEFSKKRANVRANQKQLTGLEKMVAVEGAGLEIKDYGTVKFKGNDLILDLLASGKHFAVTARETDEKQSMQNDEGQFMSVATGRKIPEGFKGLDYNVKTVIHTFIEEDGTVCGQIENKDRTGICKQGEIIERPRLTLWQAAIDRTKGKKDFVLQNNMKTSVDSEMKIYEKEIEEVTGEVVEEKESATKDPRDMSKKELLEKIQETIQGLSASKKRGVGAKLTDFGINKPSEIKNVEEIETLVSILDIVSNI